MKRTGEAPVCLLWTGLFLRCVEFWQAAPAAMIRQPALPWPGEEGRHNKLGEGGQARGEGLWGMRGARVGRGRGQELTEGYKYPPEPDDHSVTVRNWWKSSGGTLGYTRPPWRHPPQTQAPLFLLLPLITMVAGLFCDIKSQHSARKTDLMFEPSWVTCATVIIWM